MQNKTKTKNKTQTEETTHIHTLLLFNQLLESQEPSKFYSCVFSMLVYLVLCAPNCPKRWGYGSEYGGCSPAHSVLSSCRVWSNSGHCNRGSSSLFVCRELQFLLKILFGKSVNHSADPGSFHNFKIWIRPMLFSVTGSCKIYAKIELWIKCTNL